MFDFRNSVIQMTASLLMSAFSTLLIEQRWKTGLFIILAGAIGVLLLGIAFAVARRIERRFQPASKNSNQRNRTKRRRKR